MIETIAVSQSLWFALATGQNYHITIDYRADGEVVAAVRSETAPLLPTDFDFKMPDKPVKLSKHKNPRDVRHGWR